MAVPSTTIDQEKLEATVGNVFTLLGGAVLSGMVYLGDRMGLYRALAGAGPVTSDDLAGITELDERWLREWLRGQAAAGLIDYLGEGRFEISPEAAIVLADETHEAFAAGGFSALPSNFAVLERLPESFRSGIGLPYDAFGRDGNKGVERLLGPWFRTRLVPVALPDLDGVTARLGSSAKVADVGCGAGVALIEMAAAFPDSTFHGYEISKHALDLAEENARAAGVKNVELHDAADEPLPADGSFDFITTFDCLHDMTDPGSVMTAIRKAIKDDGTWLIGDIRSLPTFEDNLRDNPMTAMMYGFSVMSCMSSALSEPGGLGLGTLGFTEDVARRMTTEAGFTRFTPHDFGHPLNAYYEVRP